VKDITSKFRTVVTYEQYVTQKIDTFTIDQSPCSISHVQDQLFIT